MTRRLRKPPPRRYSYVDAQAITRPIPIVPQTAPRREGAVGRAVVALVVSVPAGALLGAGLFWLVLSYAAGVLP